jgi:diguanylate cyclase (GGDEF)-like protein
VEGRTGCERGHASVLSISHTQLPHSSERRTYVTTTASASLGTVSFKWAGVISSDSVVARHLGAHRALLVGLGMIALYLAVNQLLMAIVRKRGRAGDSTIAAAVIADMTLLFGIMYVITPPLEYPRGLIVSIFTIQFTQLFFGARATMYNLACVALFYALIIIGAENEGFLGAPTEHFWDLALFMLGVGLFVMLQGQMQKRLGRIIAIFERAQEGDFSLEYDESHDKMPDSITVVGRAYNRMRVQLERIVLTDPLSGCYNRRGFDQLVTREVSRAVRGGHPISVLALDVDHFKRVNDEFGHLTGDEVLREMGSLLRDTARLGDVVARIGGEEFEILAPDTNVEGAQILADRIHHAFAMRVFASVGGQRKITISIGIASESARNDQIAGTLMARADEALYVAKRNGRNRTETWHAAMRAFDGSTPGRRSIELSTINIDALPT